MKRLKISQYIETTGKQKKPIKFIVSKILIRLKCSHVFSFKYKHHYLKFFPTYLSRILWVDPDYGHSGSKTEDFIWNYLEDGNIFVDVGANIGTTTLEASNKIGKGGKIYSFEANPKIFNFLKKNIMFNKSKNINIFNCAIGSESKRVFFSDVFADESNSVQNEESKLMVEMKTLDEIIPNDLKINLMKIDVLGYEKFVLLGAKKILNNITCIHFPAIAHFYKKYNYSYEQIFRYLRDYGFLICIINNNGFLEELPDEFKPEIGDYIAIKSGSEFLKYSKCKLL